VVRLPGKESVLKKNKGLVFLVGMLAAAALACNFPSVTPTPTVDVYGTVTAMIALTQGAGQTPAAAATVFTSTTFSTPTVALTLPPSVPVVSVSVDTNCRAGPGIAYDRLAGLFVGEKAEVIGKYTSVSPAYWIVRIGSATCWLWGQYATVEGNTANLPEMAPPPSPTPTNTPTPTLTPTITQTPTVTSTPSATASITTTP
jgi:uncharacterized protein YgiM (DUF1202 family)